MEKLKKVGNVLAEGENTGHSHRVLVDVMEREDGVRIFEGETDVTHEEHKTIHLPKRKWNSAQIEERDYLSGMMRKVQD